MQILALRFFSLFFCLSSLFVYAEGEVRDNSTGVTFPREVSFEEDGKQYQLQATGVATRKKFFVKVYSIASYLQSGFDTQKDILPEIMSNDTAKQLTMKWVHEASSAKIVETFKDSFHNSLSDADYNRLQGEINKFLQFFNQDVQKGDEHILRWLPGGRIEVIINGKNVGNVTHKDFAKGLWNIWFGQKSPVNRGDLISLVK